MSIILTKIISVLLTPFIAISGFFSHIAPQPLGVALPQGPAVFETSLLSAITSSATSLTLTANSVRGGSSLSGTNCFTIDEGKAEREDVCGTVSGTTVSSLTRGIDPLTATTTNATLQFAHRRGAQVKITDFPLIQIMRHQLNGSDTFANPLSYASSTLLLTASSTSTQIPYVSWVFNNFPDLYSNQTIAGIKTFSSFLITPSSAPTTDYQVANKKYVDDVSVAGAPDANTTTKGIVEEATTAEVTSGSSVGGTGAKLFITPSAFVASDISFYKTSTTSEQNLATTTLDLTNIRSGITTIRYYFHASSTVPASASAGGTCIFFNTYTGSTDYSYTSQVVQGSDTGNLQSTADDMACFTNTTPAKNITITGEIHQIGGMWRHGTATYLDDTGATGGLYGIGGPTNVNIAGFNWKQTVPITSISFTTQSVVAKFATSTYMEVTGN